MAREGVAPDSMRLERVIDLRYVGQSYHLPIALPTGAVSGAMLIESRERFEAAHLAAYGYAEANEPCELVNLRISAVGAIPRPALEEAEGGRMRRPAKRSGPSGSSRPASRIARSSTAARCARACRSPARR